MKKKFLLRMNPELWEELNCWADQEFRSVNAQIEFLLREAVQRRGRSISEVSAQGEPPAPARRSDEAEGEAS
jgi:hypothetical protein